MAAATGAGLLMAGCNVQTLWKDQLRQSGPLKYSRDAHTYVSTPDQPLTITLIDTRTDEIVWSIDVPVGKQLSMMFKRDKGAEGEFMPDLLTWDLFEPRKRFGKRAQSQPVPPEGARLLDVTIREPEAPPA